MQQEPNKLKELYSLYEESGLLGGAEYELFESADDEQKKQLFDLAASNNILGDVDYDTFSSAWGQKKKTQAIPDSIAAPSDSSDLPLPSVEKGKDDYLTDIQNNRNKYYALSADKYQLEKKIESFNDKKNDKGEYVFENDEELNNFNTIVDEYKSLVNEENKIIDNENILLTEYKTKFKDQPEEKKEDLGGVKDWLGKAWNSTIEGISHFSNNFTRGTGLNDEKNMASFIQENKDKYPELYANYQKNIDQRNPALLAFISMPKEKQFEIGDRAEVFRRKKASEEAVDELGVNIDEQISRNIEETFFGGAISGLAKSIPAMALSSATLGMSFFDQSYQDAEQKLVELEDRGMGDISRSDKETYKLINAAASLALERVGLSNVIKGSSLTKKAADHFGSKVFNRIAMEAAEDPTKKITKEGFDRILNEEASEFVKYLKRTGQAGLSEFETGALQNLSTDLTEQGINAINGREIFDSKTAGQIAYDAIYSGGQEMFGGFTMGATLNILNNENPTLDEKNEFIELVSSDKNFDNISKELSKEAKENTIAGRKAKKALEKITEYRKAIDAAPKNLDKKNKVYVVDLLRKKQQLQKEMDSKDDAFKKPFEKRINEINNLLSEVEIPTEQPVQETEAFSETEQKVESEQKPIVSPETSRNYANLTEDSEGNFVFFHKGQKGYDKIKPASGTNKVTGREEAAAIGKVGGVAMYYTQESDQESGVTGDATYAVKIPKEEVYDFNSDPNNYIEEAKRRHDKEHPNKAFDVNTQLAYVTKIAGENGYKMVVSEWQGSSRAQTTEALKPSDVKLRDGNTVTQDFSESFETNREMGYTPEARKNIEGEKAKLFEEIQKLAGDNYSSTEYKMGKLANYKVGDKFVPEFPTQESVDKAITESTVIPQELKDRYEELKTAEELPARSVRSEEFVSKNGVRSKAFKMESAPEGTYLDIELVAGKDGRKLSQEEVIKALPEPPIVVENDGNNLRLRIPNKLSDSQMMDLMKATEQEAIAQVHNKKGVLHAQNEKLLNDYGGAFNPDYFKLPQQPINQEDNAIQERETTEVPSQPEAQPVQEVEGEVRGEREGQEGTQEEGTQAEESKGKEKPIDKKKKKSINKLKGKVLNSLNRGKLNDIREEVADLISLRLHAIDNEQLLSEVETVLKGLSARVPKVDSNFQGLAARAKAAIKDVESQLSPNDLTADGIDKQISKSIPERISKLEGKDFSIDNLVGARSSFTRILNDIRKLEEAVNILSDVGQLESAEQSLSKLQSLREQLATVASKHQEAIEKAQKQLNASNKKRASSFRPKSITSDKLLQDEIDSFLEQVDNLDSDQIELTVDINTILDDLDVGFIPIANMAAIKNEVRANSQIKSDNFRKAVDNINGMPKKAKNFIGRLFQRFTDPRRKAETSLKKWEDEIRASEFSQWEYLAGTAQNPAFVNINNDYITATEQYRESGAVEMEKLHRAANLRLGEKAKAAVDFSEGLMRNQDRYVKVGMLMFERFWQNKYGVSYIDKMMKDTNLLEKISDDSTRNSYEKMFKSLPKNKDGSIDYQKAISNLSGVEKRLFDVANKMFDPRGEMARKQMIAASKRGMLFTPAQNYFPVLRKLGAETKDVSLDELNDILIPKISSDRAKQQKSQDISLVDLNLFNVMSSYIHEVNRDFYLTDPVRTGNKFYNKAIKESDGTARTAMEGFKRGFTNNIVYTFSPKATSKLQKWTNKLLAATYIDYLVKAGRSFVSEPISEGLRTVLASDYNHRMYKDAANSLDSSVKDMIAKIKGLEYKDGRISTTGEFRSNFKKLLSLTNAPFNKDFSRQFSDGSIRITSFENKDSNVDKVASYVLGTPNRATLFRAWMPAFNNKFKEVTGVDIDYNKLNDSEYVRENRKAIKEAGAYANYKTSLLKGFSSAAGGRTMNKVPFFGNIDANKSPIAFKLNQFLSSFGFRDAFLLKEGVRDMALATSEKVLGKGLGIDAFKDATAQASGTGARGFRIVGGLTLAGIIYPILQDMISYLSMDDDEDKLKNWEKELKEKIESGNYFSPKEMAKQVISYYVFTASSKYGYASRIMTLFSLGVIEDMLNGQAKRAKSAKEKKAIKDDIQSIKGLSRAFFFTEPINLNLMGNSYMDKTSLPEGLAMVPAAGIALDYAGEMAQSLELLNSTEGDEQQKALGLVTYDAMKLMMLRKGTAFPFIGDLDKEAYKVKREMKKPQPKDEGGRTVKSRTTSGRVVGSR